VDAGAHEIDLVANAGWLKAGQNADYAADIVAVRKRIGDGIVLKVIIEAALLTPEQVVRAATLAVHSGCNFVKTSTGVYSKARVEDVQLLRRALPERVKIKAAGGIRTASDAEAMITAGADRIGTSNSIAIAWESKK
jgi:deoxyribose-phosphate aldolase